MNWKRRVVLACVVLAALWGTNGWSEEVTGSVTEAGYGQFKLNDGDITRLFLLSGKSSQYEPDTWRPAVGDELRVDFLVVPGRRGIATLSVVKATLLKAGPSTPVNMESPLAVELVEVGRSGVRARIPSGHILKFSPGRGAIYLPPGWVPMAGEKATINYRVQPQGFGIDYIMEKMEKVRKTPAPEAAAPAPAPEAAPAPAPEAAPAPAL
jgi:hypothetical protein